MRVLLVILALLLLPVLALLHRYHFYRSMQGQLLAQVMHVLEAPELSNVRSDHGTVMNHLDVILSGTVPEIAWRERARQLVSQIHGIRCREEDNHIHVPAGIDGELKGKTLELKGWLHDEATLQDAKAWLMEARPDLMVDTQRVRISPYVTPEESPKKVRSPLFQPLWTLIEVPAELNITREGDALKISGELPLGTLKAEVIKAALGTRTDTTLDTRGLKSGPYVKPVPFSTKADALNALVRVLFDSQESTTFHADGETISFTADVTEEQFTEWKPLVVALGDLVRPTWHVHPTIYHLPNYKPVSKLPAELLTKLRTVLSGTQIAFAESSDEVAEEQMAAVNACSQAINEAHMESPDLRIIVGSQPESHEDLKAAQSLAKRRSEAVIEQFEDRGLPGRIFEIVPFPPPHAADQPPGDRPHTVEMFVK